MTKKLLAPIRNFTTYYVLCPKCDNEVFSSDKGEYPDGVEFKCKACGAKFEATSDIGNEAAGDG